MRPKSAYGALCVVGFGVPYWQFLAFLRENGLNLPLLVQQAFTTRGSSFFALDVLASALTVIVLAHVEGLRASVRNRWLSFLALLVVGVSLALPLFLYLREDALDRAARAPSPSAIGTA